MESKHFFDYLDIIHNYKFNQLAHTHRVAPGRSDGRILQRRSSKKNPYILRFLDLRRSISSRLIVLRLLYDPRRTAMIALTCSEKGFFSYICHHPIYKLVI